MGKTTSNNFIDNLTKYGQLGGIALVAWLQTQFPSRASFDELSKKMDALQTQVTTLQAEMTQLNATQQRVSEIGIKVNEFETRIRVLEISNAKIQTPSNLRQTP
jgi:hypothetical protein